MKKITGVGYRCPVIGCKSKKIFETPAAVAVHISVAHGDEELKGRLQLKETGGGQ